MTPLSHAHRFPNARVQTVVDLIRRDEKTAELWCDITLGIILEKAVSKALAGFTREQADRIRESF